MTDLLNPYIAGAPVVAADMFFGRADIFEWVERSLMGKYVDHILVIHGQRRVGKTSILKQLPNHLPDRYIQVFFDLQGRTTTSPGRFFWWLSREISRAIKGSNGGTVVVPERTELEANPEYLFTRFLPEVQSALDGRVLLLTFDEFDTLNEPGVGETLALPLIQTLRRMMELEGLSFIYSIGSSGQKLENMQARYTEFFKSALYRKISFLERETCRELITEPVAGVLEYQPEAVSRIYQVTAGHPYFTQLVCHELFSRCQQSGVRKIQRADVDGVLEQVIERGTVNLKFVWDEADDLEKWALACLARADECRDPAELARTLGEQRVRFSEPDLNRALVHLREKDVLGADNRFVVYLLRVWLRHNRPLERVREELVEVSPIANRFIEIGEEYWAQGERESALESFRQALEVDPGSVKALVHLGALLLEVGQEREAVEAFATALEIDGEDINALRGYCKVQLKLGDQARVNGDEQAALESYQAILAVNPEYQLARERLAVLYRERAEAHLLDGNDEAALLAFQAALSYTPQDAELAERFVQVKGERLQGAVANLTAKVEKATAADEWETALTALRDALLIVGKDEELEKRLADVKAGQRAYLLRTLPQAARRSESQDDWEQACETWRAYLALYPEDQPEAEAALAHAQQMLELQGKYAEAQAALGRKDYPSAIQLLQGIVQVNPGYKDTTRLLGSAVKASQRSTTNILRYGWYALPVVFIVLSIAGYFAFGDRVQLPDISSLINVEVTQTDTFSTESIPSTWDYEPRTTGVSKWGVTPLITPSPAVTSTPIETQYLTATALPSPTLPPEMVSADQLFEDGISSRWDVPNPGDPESEYVEFEGESLVLSSEFGQGGQLSLDHGADQFVAQFKMMHLKGSGGDFYVQIGESYEEGSEFSLDIMHPNFAAYSYSLNGYEINEYGYMERFSSGFPTMAQPEFRYMTIRYHPDLLEITLDELVLLSMPNPGLSSTEITLGVYSDGGKEIVQVDDFLIWDTRDLESPIAINSENMCTVTERIEVYYHNPDDPPSEPNSLPYRLYPGTPFQVEDVYQTVAGVEWNQVRVGTFFTVWIPSEAFTTSCQPVASSGEADCVITGAVLPRDAPSVSESSVLESVELEAFTPVTLRDFAVDDEGQIWGFINWDESNLQEGSGYVLARELSIGCFECETVSASETKRSDINVPDPPSSDLDYVNAREPVALWKMGEKDDGSTWLHIYGSGSSSEGSWELGWIPASSLAQSCFAKLDSVFCTVTRRIQNKYEPYSDSPGGPANYSSVGDKLSVREKTIGTDGQDWYRIINDTTGGSGWLPSGVLTIACKQITPEP